MSAQFTLAPAVGVGGKHFFKRKRKSVEHAGAAAQVTVELPRELVVAIARASGHGVTLATMLQVCRAWRGALNAEIASLWRAVALARFPRLHGIVAAAGAQAPCYRTLYRDADDQARLWRFGGDHPVPELDQYVITAELEMACTLLCATYIATLSEEHLRSLPRAVVARGSARLDRALGQDDEEFNEDYVNGSLVLTKEAEHDWKLPNIKADEYYDANLHGAGGSTMYVAMYVTRLSDMKTTQIMAADTLGASQDEGGCVCFELVPLRRVRKLFAATDHESDAVFAVHFDPLKATLAFRGLERVRVQGHDDEGMNVYELQKYLAHYAVWSDVDLED